MPWEAGMSFVLRCRPPVLHLLMMLLILGCAKGHTARVELPAAPSEDVLGFTRVLVAGFLAGGVESMDVNQETSRFIRQALRSRGSGHVIEREPLDLVPMARPDRQANGLDADLDISTASSKRPAVSDTHDRVFLDRPFWRRLGEEYSEPLILTGSVAFTFAGSRMEERTVGRRTVRVWLNGYRLSLHVVVISGRTGEIILSDTVRPRTAFATTVREGPLAIYFRLMEQVMPSILAALGQERNHVRTLLR
jgi:hypothetical protein